MSANDSARSGADSDAADRGSTPATSIQADNREGPNHGIYAYFVPLIVLIVTAIVAIASFDTGRPEDPAAANPYDRHRGEPIASIADWQATNSAPFTATPTVTVHTLTENISAGVNTPANVDNTGPEPAGTSTVTGGHRGGSLEPGKTADQATATAEAPPTNRPTADFRRHAIPDARAMAQGLPAEPLQDYRKWLEHRHRLEEQAHEAYLGHAFHHRTERRRRIEQEERAIYRRMHDIERGYPPGLNQRQNPPERRGAYAGYFPI